MSRGPGNHLAKKTREASPSLFFWSMKKSILLVSELLLIPAQGDSVSPS